MMVLVQNYFSLKVFAFGCLAVAVLYGVLFGFTALNAEKTLLSLEETLDTRMIAIPNFIQAQPLGQKEPSHGDNPDTTPDTSSQSSLKPMSDLVEKGILTGALLPKVSAEGFRPFDIYKKDFTASGSPVIAVVIFDFGLGQKFAESILSNIPSEVTFLLSPYATNLQNLNQKAQKNEHEIWLEVKTAGLNLKISDPGSLALLPSNGLRYNQERLEYGLSKISNYAGVGVRTYKNFDAVPTITKNLFKDIFNRGLGYFEMNSDLRSSVVHDLALSEEVPYISNNSAHHPDFDLIEKNARADGSAVALFNASEMNLEQFTAWVNGLERKGFDLAPLSALAQRQ